MSSTSEWKADEEGETAKELERVCQAKLLIRLCTAFTELFLELAKVANLTSQLIYDESQAEIKITERNINNLRYADDTTLMAESKEELKNLLMTVKEESKKAGLKPNIQETKIMISSPITSWKIDGEKMETVTNFYFLGLQNHWGWRL